ncbi:MAG: helix-turn-helix domain-containing protein [Nitrospira sp.]
MRTRCTVNGALLDVKSAAEFLGGSERWLRRLVERGVVPHRRIGRNLYFKRNELEQFVEDLEGITPRQARFNGKRKTAGGRYRRVKPSSRWRR